VDALALHAYGFGDGPFPVDNPYPDGSLYLQLLWDTGSEWLQVGNEDAEFNAQFSPASVKEQAVSGSPLSPASAPEPSSLALLALSGVPLFGILRRRVAV
jgi:hypothetical protein